MTAKLRQFRHAARRGAFTCLACHVGGVLGLVTSVQWACWSAYGTGEFASAIDHVATEVGTNGYSGSLPTTSEQRMQDLKSAYIDLAETSGSAGGGQEQLWQTLGAYLPDRGRFTMVPGGQLRPVLVHDGEFPFCAQIACNKSANVLGAWNGGAFDSGRAQFRVHGGGHADYGGNEVYVFDFSTLRWMRETDPRPLTGPLMRDNDRDGVADACPAPISGPPATHTYQGFIYVPKIDRYWLFGSVGFCQKGMSGSAAWEYDAGTKTWAPMPELVKFASFARAVIDPDSGNVVIHGGPKEGWREIDPRDRHVVRAFEKDPFGKYIDGPAVFDHAGGTLYALIGGRRKDRLVAYSWPSPGKSDGFAGHIVAEWPQLGRKTWGMAQHASGLLVLWDGNARILVVDPKSGQSWEKNAEGLPQTLMTASGKGRNVYSKWSYISSLDAFFGISHPDLGIILYRLDTNNLGAAVPAMPPPSGTKSGQ